MRNVTLSLPAAMKWFCAVVVAEWINVPGTMKALLLLMAIDYVTGIAAAWRSSQLSSAVGLRGLIAKIVTIMVLLSAHVVEVAAGKELHVEEAGALVIIFNEFISIVENGARCGAPIPAAWVEKMAAVKKLYRRATPAQLAELDDDHAPDSKAAAGGKT